MTVNCHPHPTLQVYGESINHATDFRYLGSKMASATSDFIRCKALAWSAFWKLECLWGSPQLSISTKMNLFYITCMTILLMTVNLGWYLMTWKVNQRLCDLLLQDHTKHQTKLKDHVPNTMIYSMTSTEPLIYHVWNKQYLHREKTKLFLTWPVSWIQDWTIPYIKQHMLPWPELCRGCTVQSWVSQQSGVPRSSLIHISHYISCGKTVVPNRRIELLWFSPHISMVFTSYGFHLIWGFHLIFERSC